MDEIPLSRPKRNIARDFADGGKLQSLFYNPCLQHLTARWVRPPGCSRANHSLYVLLLLVLVLCLTAVLLAEVVAHYFPKLVELHNYRYITATASAANDLPVAAVSTF